MRRRPVAERLADKLIPEGSCLVWTGAQGHNGYGLIWHDGRCRRVHRVAYEIAYGPIPPDRPHVDHVRKRGCTSRLCCRPEHLEAVTQPVNNQRAAETRRQNRATAREMVSAS